MLRPKGSSYKPYTEVTFCRHKSACYQGSCRHDPKQNISFCSPPNMAFQLKPKVGLTTGAAFLWRHLQINHCIEFHYVKTDEPHISVQVFSLICQVSCYYVGLNFAFNEFVLSKHTIFFHSITFLDGFHHVLEPSESVFY